MINAYKVIENEIKHVKYTLENTERAIKTGQSGDR